METPGPGSLKTRLVLPVSLVVGVVIVGTLGYRWLWRGIGGTWLDALFMTVTTITTIGYGEVKPLSSAGRVFTMAIVVAGIGAFFYAIEDLALPPASPAVGRTLEALAVRQATGASVLAVLREGAPITNPSPDLVLETGDRLLALGTGDQLERLEKLIAPG